MNEMGIFSLKKATIQANSCLFFEGESQNTEGVYFIKISSKIILN